MNKDNIFRSSNFHMDEGDTLHMLVEDVSGVTVSIVLVASGEEDTIPNAPVAIAASDKIASSFTANWRYNENADGYYLDVSTNSAFTDILAGYNNLDVGNIDSYPVAGLTPGVDYYYRLRSYNDTGTSANSNTISATTTVAFNICFVRNAELDNTLSLAASTKLTVTTKVGQVLTASNLPDYDKFDNAGWVMMLCDSSKTNGTGDPSVNGDYLYKYFCSINRATKELTVTGNLINCAVGDTFVLYNSFMNYTFVGNQVYDSFLPILGAPIWRSGGGTAGGAGGPMFRHSDGRFIWMFIGYQSTPTRGRIGYAYSTNMVTWTIGNGDNFVYDSSSIPDCASLTIGGTATPCNDGTGRYWCSVYYSQTSNGHCTHRILYFDEDLTTFTYSAPVLADSELGYFGGNIVKIGSYYHLITLLIANAGVIHRKVQVFKSLTLEGPYVWYQDIVEGHGSNDGVAWSYSVDAPLIYNDGTNIFALFGGTSQWAQSGTKGNREFCLVTFNSITEVWTISKRGPVIINPMYYQNLNGMYDWAGDHIGGFNSIFVEGDDIYVSATMKGSSYQMALLKLTF